MIDPVGEIVLMVVASLVFGPLVLGPPVFIFYKIAIGIRKRNRDPNIDLHERKFKNYLSYAFILFSIFSISLICLAIYMDHVPFLVILLLFIFVVPFFMVIISFLGGIGKAFEAGFNATTFLNTLNSISKKAAEKNRDIESDAEK